MLYPLSINANPSYEASVLNTAQRQAVSGCTADDEDDGIYSIPVFNNACYTEVTHEHHLPVSVNPSYCCRDKF